MPPLGLQKPKTKGKKPKWKPQRPKWRPKRKSRPRKAKMKEMKAQNVKSSKMKPGLALLNSYMRQRQNGPCLGFRGLGFRASPLRTRCQSHARMAPPSHLKGVGVAAYRRCQRWWSGVTFGMCCPNELGQHLLFPPTCRFAGGHPTFRLLGFRASP